MLRTPELPAILESQALRAEETLINHGPAAAHWAGDLLPHILE
jgi:hypothetical protein